MVRSCPQCGSYDIDEDAARGDATCTNCGTVLEESIVVSENQFQEKAGGGYTRMGQQVSMDRQHHTQGGVVAQESRELTHQKGKRLIEEIASQLRLHQLCIDMAFTFFKTCVRNFLTRGRVRSHVVAACLYMACRLENLPHLLLDFSDITQVNVFDLGRTLSFISRALKINLPSTDPCLYVLRFACFLEFGEHRDEVVALATRLVQRMKRDWISTGRRPTGLCGAALLIAARAFNFNRSIADVVRVVHISETVVRKRLEEFSQTPSGALTIDEFKTVDLDQTEDPPAYREARRKAQEAKRKEEQIMAEKMAGEVHQMEAEVEKALEKKRREKFKHTPYAKLLTGADQIDEDVGRKEAEFVNDEIMQSVYDVADEPEQGSSGMGSQYGPTLQFLGIGKIEPAMHIMDDPIPLPSADNENGDLNLDDIDDEEIDSYILSNAESEVKAKFWMKVNGEHLKEMERRKREREEAEAKEPDTKKKKRKPPANGIRSGAQENGPPPSTAIEAIEKVIQEKKLSNKVNYDILKEIDQGMPEIVEEPVIKPLLTFEPSLLIKRERNIARKNCHGANVARLNMLREALNVEEDEGMRLELKGEPPEDLKPLLARKRNLKPRAILTKKEEPEADVLKSPTRKANGTTDAKSAIQKVQKAPPIVELDKETSQPPLCQDEATTSNTANQDTVEVVKVVQPAGRLQRGKRLGPVLKVKEEKKHETEAVANVDPEPSIIADTSTPEVVTLHTPTKSKEPPEKDPPKPLARRIQVKPSIGKLKK